MSTRVVTGHRESARLRTARRDHRCWAWAEKCSAPGDGWDGQPTCTRMIAKGETYLESTIYPGHESGYADDRMNLVGGVWLPAKPRPMSTKHCLPCAARWSNLKDALAELLVETEPAS